MQLDFRASLAPRSDALDITYVIENRGKHDLGIFKWIPWPRPDGTVVYPSSLAYVELVGPVVLLRKMALPVPPSLQIRELVAPKATRIPAGTTFSERIFLNVPVTVMQPFRAAALRLERAADVVADAPAKARLLRLEIGVFPLDERTRLVAEHPAHPQVLTVFPPGAGISSQQSLVFDTGLDRPIRVHDYRAVPWDEVG